MPTREDHIEHMQVRPGRIIDDEGRSMGSAVDIEGVALAEAIDSEKGRSLIGSHARVDVRQVEGRTKNLEADALVEARVIDRSPCLMAQEDGHDYAFPPASRR